MQAELWLIWCQNYQSFVTVASRDEGVKQHDP